MGRGKIRLLEWFYFIFYLPLLSVPNCIIMNMTTFDVRQLTVYGTWKGGGGGVFLSFRQTTLP